MKKSIWGALCALLAASLACSLGDFPQAGQAADPNILFQDDFSSSFTGWDSYRGDEGITDYEDGSYRILVNQSKMNYWATPGLEDKLPDDVRVEVEASKIGGPDANSFGIICRYTSQDDLASFYYFSIASTGHAGIFKVANGEETLLTGGGEQMVQTGAINDGAAMNRITAECIGNTLTLSVNGTRVDSVTDTSFADGDIGLIAGTYDDAGTDVSFDNLKVTKP